MSGHGTVMPCPRPLLCPEARSPSVPRKPRHVSPTPRLPRAPADFAPWSQALTTVSLQGPRSPLDMASSRSSDAARPVGQVDRHIQLLVHGVGQAGEGSGQMWFHSCLGLLTLAPGISRAGAGWERTGSWDVEG